MDKNTINKLAYDLTYQRYLLNKDKANYLFNDLSVGDYVVLHTVLCFEDKAYLEKLGEKLNLSISKMSNVATNLKNRINGKSSISKEKNSSKRGSSPSQSLLCQDCTQRRTPSSRYE